ncbi:MAG TPA: ATP-binding cassette domain-containing protein, partial [Gammaproteobacteria bacterium]|nr:ATP-binding cassette domain-containing protein [Gammaproteobacteria bacterium]
MSELVIDNVWQSYDEQVVLEGLHLRVCGPEFCAIVGASGCGKSTFLRLLLGQEQPSRGRILLDGEPLPREPGPDRGVVFQQYSVFPHLTVLENAMFGLELQRRRWDVRIGGRLWGRARGEVREQAEQALAQVGLSGARDKYPALLSGGMRQRLSLAQSIVTRPKILLLDEPFGALDPGVRSDMHEL